MARINGNNGDNSLQGTGRNDKIYAKGGDDRVEAGGGNDYVDAGSGDDWVDGGTGNDKLKGGSGDDTLVGGAGADKLYGGDGNDVLMGDGQPGGSGSASGSGSHHGSGSGSGGGSHRGSGSGSASGSHQGSGSGSGSGSADVSFNDYLDGGSGDDLVLGQLGDDTLKGGSGNDILDGGVGRDSVDGDSGDDTGVFVGGENGGGVDWYDGGTGTDTLVISLTGAQFADSGIQSDLFALAQFIATNNDSATDSGARETFSNLGIEVQDWEALTILVDGEPVDLDLDPLFTQNPDGVDFDDVQAGTYEDGTQYDALDGDDTVTMASDAGEAAEAGFDTSRTFNAGDGDDNITGRGLDDKIDGDDGDDTLIGGAGDDTLNGGAGEDTIYGDTPGDDVESSGPVTVLSEDFDSDDGGFSYQDDTFRGTDCPPYESGAYHAGDGEISVALGGIDGADIYGMSGGFTKTFTVDGDSSDNTITFKYRLEMSSEFESDEYGEVLVSINGDLIGVGGNDYVLRQAGDGNGGSDFDSGWVEVTIDVGDLPAGEHELALGGYLNKKTYCDEDLKVSFTEVEIVGIQGGAMSGSFDDTITGGAGNDVIDGQQGDDVLIGDNAESNVTSETFFANGNEQAWNDAGVTLSALDFDGSPATVTYDGDGVGVAGGSPVGNQINHDDDGSSETLIATFDAPATEATITVARMYATENGGEQGAWKAYDAEGNLVGQGEFGPEITGGGNVGSFTVSGIGEFSSIEFTGREYANGTPPGSSDSSDYYVQSIEYTTVEGGTGEAGDDVINGGSGDDYIVGDNTEVGEPGGLFLLGGRDVPQGDYDVDALWNQELFGHQVTVTPFSDLGGGTVGEFDFETQGGSIRGIGVEGGDPEVHGIEGIEVDFGGLDLTEVTVGLRALFTESQAADGVETATWSAFKDGVEVATGEIDAISGSPDGRAEASIEVPGGFDTLQFYTTEAGSDFHLEYIEGEVPGTGDYGDDIIDGGSGDDVILGDSGSIDCVGHEWNWEFGDTGHSTAGGKVENLNTTFDIESQTLDFTMVVSDTNGRESNGFTLALNSGANPKGLGGELALLYFDASGAEPVLTAYAYNGVNAQTSYFDGSSQSGTQAPDPIASSIADASWIHDITFETDASGDVHTFHFSIDASVINDHDPMYTEAGGWTGIEFGDELGMWLHPNSDVSTSYNPDGFLDSYTSGGHGWIDVAHQGTDQIKAAPDAEGGDDVIDGGTGDDLVYGQGGDDTIVGGVGDDELYGQSGNDVIDGDAPSGITFDTIENDDGCYDISGACEITINVDYLSSFAGHDNSFGYYLAGADGNPVSGTVMFADVKTAGDGVGDVVTITLDADDLDGVEKLGFFIIPDGADLNGGLSNGDDVTFEQSGGDWQILKGGAPLSGAGADVLFSDENQNPGGFDHEEDAAPEGNMNWEDIVNGGDQDHNDINLNVTVEGAFFGPGLVYDGAPDSGSASGGGQASGSASGSAHASGSGSASGHAHGSGSGSASGHAHGSGSGSGSGWGHGSGSGSASGHAHGSGSGSASGHGHGSGSGSASGSAHGSASGSGHHGGSGSASGSASHAGSGSGGVEISFNDYLDGGAGDDILDGNLGADVVYGNDGNDIGEFIVGEYGGLDQYDGGTGTDTLRLFLTSEQFADPNIQAEVQALRNFIAANADPSTDAGPTATFTLLDLQVQDWEELEIFVDGKPLVDNELVDAVDDSADAEEGGPAVVIDVLNNDDAPDGVGSVTIVTPPGQGTATVNPDNTISFDPNGEFDSLAEGETATVTFTYELEDTDGDTDIATVTVTVTGTNDEPTITVVPGNGDSVDGDVKEIADGAPGENTDDLTANGSITFDDADLSDSHTVSSAPNGGGYIGTFNATIATVATGAGAGSIDWDFTVNDGLLDSLNEGEQIVQSYDVTVDDGNGGTDTQTITITIEGTNDAPVVQDVTVTGVTEDSPPVTDDFDGDDVDNEDDPSSLTYTITTPPSEGIAINNGDGTFSFDPNGDFSDLGSGESREVTFTYTATDAQGAVSNTGTVTVTVTGANEDPIVDIANTDDSGSVKEIADNAPGENTDDLTANGVITFDDADVSDSHTVSASPNGGGYIGTFNAVLTTAATGPGAGSIDWDFTVNDGLLDSLNEGEQIVQSYDVTIDDGNGGTDTQTVTITIEGTNDAPIVQDVTVTGVIEDGATVTDSFDGDDVDDEDDGSTLTYNITSAPSEGSVANNGDGTFTFDPEDDFQDLAEGETRDVTFEYTATDAQGAVSNTGTVTVTVTGTNDEPTITVVPGNGDSVDGDVKEIADNATGENVDDLTANGSITFDDADLSDGHTISSSPNGGGYIGTFNAIIATSATGASAGSIDWDFTVNDGLLDSLNEGEQIVQSYDVTVDDGNGGTDTQTVTITIEGTNDAPIVQDVAVTGVIEDGAPVSDSFDGDDVDDEDDGSTLTYDITSAPSEGSVVNNGDGTFTFDPEDDFQDLAVGETRDVTFEYTATDAQSAVSNTGTVTVTVTGTNDDPVAKDDAFTITEDFILTGNVLGDNGNGADSDIDNGDTINVVETVITTAEGGTVTMLPDGSFSYTPFEHFSGTDTFEYTIVDSQGATDTATATITVIPDADVPDITVVEPARGNPGQPIPLDITIEFPDQDGSEVHTITICDVPEGATFNNGTQNPDGSWSMTQADLVGLTITTPPFSTPAFAPTYDLSTLLPANGGDGSQGFIINGIGNLEPDPGPSNSQTDALGYDVSNAGDVNGDGIDDVIVSAILGESTQTNEGEAYVIFGTDQGFDPEFEVFDLLASQGGDGSEGFVIRGIDADDRLGLNVRSAGDVNGDGIDDIITGSFKANPNGENDAGQAYVIFGTNSGFDAEIEMDSLDGTNGYQINGDPLFVSTSNDFTGYSVGGGYDMDGDGIDDILVGARGNDPVLGINDNGATYLVLGGESRLASLDAADGTVDGEINLEEFIVDGVNIFEFEGVDAGDHSGVSVSGSSDLNGDGIDDILIGARHGDPNGSNSGEVYVVFGGLDNLQAMDAIGEIAPLPGDPILPPDGEIQLAYIDGQYGYVFDGVGAADRAGRSVSDAGDLNGDGLSDIIIGAYGADGTTGEGYVVFGGLDNFQTLDAEDGSVDGHIELSELFAANGGDGSGGFVITAENAGDRLGQNVRNAGDVNGDGLDDLIIGAPNSDASGGNAGTTYVVFGSSGGFGAELNLDDIRTGDGSDGFAIDGINAFDLSGWSVSGAGDVNGDGIDDIVIGAYGGDPHGNTSGEAYVIFGRTGLSVEDFTLTIKATATEQANGDSETSTDTLLVDINEAPNVDDEVFDIDENSPNGTSVGSADGTDPDAGDTITYAITGGTGVGVFDIDETTGEITVIDGSQLDFETTESFTLTVEVTDTLGLTDTGVITINLNDVDENQLVDATDDTGTVSEDGPGVIIDVVANDDVPDGLGGVTVVTGPSEGTATVNPDNTITFDPNGDFDDLAVGESREVTFTYEVEDTDGDTDIATVTVTVTGTNDDPEISVVPGNGDSVDGDVKEIADNAPGENVDDLTANGSITFDDADISDGHTISASPNGGGYIGTFNAVIATSATGAGEGSIDWDFTVNDGLLDSLNEGEQIVQSYDVTVDDGNGGTDTQTVTITIEGTNDAPIVQDVTVTGVIEDGSAVSGNFDGDDVDNEDDGSTLTYSITTPPSEGAAINNGDGTFTFDPEDDFQDLAVGETRDVTFEYTAADAQGAVSNTGTVTVTVTGTNDEPTITVVPGNGDSVDGDIKEIADNATGENVDDLTANGSITFDDADLSDGHTISSSPNAGGYIGTFNAVIATAATGAGNGSIDWDFTVNDGLLDSLNEGEQIVQSYDVTIDDGNGGTDTQTVTITIEGTNDAPIVQDVTVTGVIEDGATVTDSFDGDDVDNEDDGSTLTYNITSAPAEGSVANNGDGTFTFDPEDDFQDLAVGETRDVTFEYTATDAQGAVSNTGTVTVTVTGTNDEPTITVVPGNGDSVDGDVKEIADNATGENVDDLTTSGSITFDDADLSDGHTVSSAPNGGGYIGTFNATIATVATGAGAGSIDWDFTVNDGLLDSLNEGEQIVQSYDVTIDDGNGGTDTQTVTITIEGTNDAPVVQDVTVTGAVEDGPTVTDSFDGDDVDDEDDGSTLTYNITSAPSEGSVVNNGDGTFTFDPEDDFQDLAPGETRDVTFNYTATDAQSAVSNTGTVTVTVVGTNDAPVVQNVGPGEDVTGVEDGPTVSGAFDGDDPDSDDNPSTLTYDITSTPSEGSVVNNGDGTFTFDPEDDFQDLAVGESRDVTFNYTATDSHSAVSNTGVVTITILGTNDDPEITIVPGNGDSVDGDVKEIADNATGENVDDLTANGSITFDDADLSDGHTISTSPNGGGYVGTFNAVIVTAATGAGAGSIDWDFTVNDGLLDSLNEGEQVVQSYDVTVDDGNGGTDTQTVTITIEGTNDAPIVQDVTVTGAVEDGAPVTDSFDGDDVDNEDDGSTLTYNITSAPSEGSVANNGDGTFTFDPEDDFQDLSVGETRDVTFTYEATDAQGAVSNTGTVTVTVAGTNDDPVVQDIAAAVSEDGPAVVDAFDGDDPDSDDNPSTLTYTITSTPVAGLVINNGDGTFSFDPNGEFESLATGESEDVTFTYTATDSHGAVSNTGTVTVTINGENDAPVAQDDEFTVTEDIVLTGNVLADNGNGADSDVDASDVITVVETSITTAEGGTVTMSSDGSFSYTPFEHFSGTDTFTYTIDDGNGGTDTATAIITVIPDADVPGITVVEPARGNAGDPIPLDITIEFPDQDGSELHTITICDVPEGATLNNGTQNPDGSWSLTPADLAGLTITTGSPEPVFGGTFDLADLKNSNGGDGSDGFVLNGTLVGTATGFDVGSAGDINGDGFSDILTGAILGDPDGVTNAGYVFLHFGEASNDGEFDLNVSDPEFTGYRFDGVDIDDRTGAAVRGVGDVNGDGFDDIFIGAHLANPDGNNSGRGYVIFGSAGNTNLADLDDDDGTADGIIKLSELLISGGGDGSKGFVVNGTPETPATSNDFGGYSLGGGIDFNGDGTDDLIFGSRGNDWARDLNGNGSINPNTEVLIDAGSTYIIYGDDAGFSAEFNVGDLMDANGDGGSQGIGDGSAGLVIRGIGTADQSGYQLSGVADMNSDGMDEVLIGARQADPNGSNSGQAYLVFGFDTTGTPELDLSLLDGTNGFTFNGVGANDRLGRATGDAGDLNGDGITDIIIGSYNNDDGGSNAGQAYVVFGGLANLGDLDSEDGSADGTIEMSELLAANGGDGSNGFVITGEAAGDTAGWYTRGAGDINNDGYDDIIVGAPRADNNGGNSGSAYVVFGKASGFGAEVNLDDIASGNGSDGFAINGIGFGNFAGWSVNAAGDVNGDGIDDLVIGAYGNDNARGDTYVIYGRDQQDDIDDFTLTIKADATEQANGDSETSTDTLLVDINKAPTVENDTFDLDENEANGTSVGFADGSDPDSVDTITYAITGGTGVGVFDIDATTGEITVIDGSQLDFETTPSFNLWVEVTDTLGLTDNGIITINLNDVFENSLLDAIDDTANATEDGPSVIIDVAANDDIPDGLVSVTLLSQPGEGSASVNPDNTITFDPGSDFQDLAPGATRDVTFTYEAEDAQGDTDTATVTVTVTGTNDDPVVQDVATTVGEDGPAVSGSFDGDDPDSDDDGSTLSYTITSGPSEGSVVNNGDGTFSFDPNGDFDDLAVGESRDVTFEYTATDSHSAVSNTGTVTVTVTGTNDDPTISVAGTDDTGSVTELTDTDAGENVDDLTSTGTITFDDADLSDGHTVSATPNGAGYIGTFGAVVGTAATGAGAGEIDWTFTVNDSLLDSLNLGDQIVQSYDVTVDDGNGGTAVQTVTITMTGTNDAPEITFTAGEEEGSVTEDDATNTVSGQLDGNDVDTGATEAWTVVGGGVGTYGTLTVDGTGQWTYTLDNATPALDSLDTGETDTEVFTVQVEDDNGATDTQTVTITINGNTDNELVTATDDTGNASEDGPSVDIDVLGNDVFPDGLGGVSILVQPSGGTATVNPDNTIKFDPNGDFEGLAPGETTDVFIMYELEDADGDTDVATITVTVTGTNDAPVVQNVALGAVEDGPAVPGAFVGDDIDSDDNPATLTYTVTSTPSEGSVTNNGDGTFSFDPGSDFQDLAIGETRDVTFEYTATDSHSAVSNTGTVTVTVTGTNDAPVVQDVASTVSEDGPAVIDAFDGDDPDSDDNPSSLNYLLTSTPALGILINNGNGTFSFDPNSQFESLKNGETQDVTFTYTATDSHGAVSNTGTVTVTVNGVNDDPIGADDLFSGTEDIALVGNVLADNGNGADSDVEGDTLSVVETSIPTTEGGTISMSSNGDFTYTPPLHFSGVDTFTYTVSDGNGGTDTATASIDVEAVADTPVITTSVLTATPGTSGVTVAVPVSVDFPDQDGSEIQTVTFSSVPDNITFSAGTKNPDGTWTISGADMPTLDMTIDGSPVFGPFVDLFELDTGFGGDGSKGFILNGINAFDASGFDVASAGDVNGDGFADVMTSAILADPDGNQTAGSTYVYLGAATHAAESDLNPTTNPMIYRFDGIDAGDRSGASIHSAGDVNGDGFDDIYISAHEADVEIFPGHVANAAGEAYIVFGSAGNANFEALDALDGSDDNIIKLENLLAANGGDGSKGFVVTGRPETASSSNEQGGFSSTGGFDFNGDGIDDIAFGARGNDWFRDLNGNGSKDNGETLIDNGATFIYYGKSTGFAAEFDLGELMDANGDSGVDITGQPFGSQGSGDGSMGFVIRGVDKSEKSGFHVSGVQDMNNDGADEILIGALDADPNGLNNAGRAYLLFGQDTIGSPEFDLSTIDGTNGFSFNGGIAGGRLGRGISDAGDINGDGVNDIVIGAYETTLGGNNKSGAAYVVFGGTGNLGDLDDDDGTADGSIEVSELFAANGGDGSKGFVLVGDFAGALAGFSVSRVGDINADGFDDIIVGAPRSNANTSGGTPKGDAGESYVIFGNDTGFAPEINLRDLEIGNGEVGFVLRGIDVGDFSGWTVNAAGDTNGDGIDDLIIGAYAADPNGGASGETYVVYGKQQLGIDDFIMAIDAEATEASNGDTANGSSFLYVDIDGDPNNNSLGGSPASEVLNGGAGNDDLNAGDGDDQVFGGDGDDIINGGDGNDMLFGEGGSDTINGGAGNDIIDGGPGVDFMDGGDGIDTLSYASSTAGVNADMMLGKIDVFPLGGSAQNFENIIGTDFDDILTGDDGVNEIFGGSGNDFLHGRNGNDTLNGGEGNDTLLANGGDELFVFENGTGDDTIQNFVTGGGSDDVADVTDFGFADFADLLAATNDSGSNTVITLDGDDSLTLIGVQKVNLHEDDFLI